jgi:DNA-binding IclR family transcriptional regulator
VRALYPGSGAFVTRTGAGPGSLSQLRRLLVETRARGFATEDGEVTAGFASVAAAVEAGTIHASVAVTWESRRDPDVDDVAGAARETAAEITRRLRHPSPRA